MFFLEYCKGNVKRAFEKLLASIGKRNNQLGRHKCSFHKRWCCCQGTCTVAERVTISITDKSYLKSGQQCFAHRFHSIHTDGIEVQKSIALNHSTCMQRQLLTLSPSVTTRPEKTGINGTLQKLHKQQTRESAADHRSVTFYILSILLSVPCLSQVQYNLNTTKTCSNSTSNFAHTHTKKNLVLSNVELTQAKVHLGAEMSALALEAQKRLPYDCKVFHSTIFSPVKAQVKDHAAKQRLGLFEAAFTAESAAVVVNVVFGGTNTP